MGSGKSTIAKLLSEKLGILQVEMDEMIVQEQGMPITEIFEKYGETHFRDLESELILRIQEAGGAVVSCGGGAILRSENVENMKKNGTIVYLSAKPETIYERVKNSTNRPLLNGNMNVEYITQLMNKRLPLYESAADIVIFVDGKEKFQVLEELEKVMYGKN